MRKTAITTLGALLLLAASFTTAHAYSNYFTGTGSFTATYPTSPLTTYGCMLCHTTSSGGTRNSYGTAFANAGHSFTAIANADSDGDTFTNLQEIVAGTYPGTASSHPAPAADTIAPVVAATFAIPATSTSLTVAITGFTASDAVGVAGYMVTESLTAPLASAAGWSGTAPGSYTFAASGSRTLYAWAKDAAGNVSGSRSATTNITLPDAIAPVVAATFAIPATSTSLTVAITGFTASDAVGVAGYMVTESLTAPLASAAGWSGTAPGSYTFAASGSRTLYAWAKDAAGNVSGSRSATTNITLPDAIAPVVAATFAIPATSTSLTVAITGFTASDAVGVAGYMVTESLTAPLASAAGWSGTAPGSYTFAASGSRTLYAWAKDAAGNVSGSRSATTNITLPDAIAPVVATTFAIPATSTSLTVAITGFTASDAVGVAGYMVKETAGIPLASDSGWSPTAQASYTFASTGAKTLFAYAKDASGNVSAAVSASTTITSVDATAPVITAFDVPTSSNSLTVLIACTATDNTGVAGYMVTESSTRPSAGAIGWSPTAPASFTFPSASTHTLYAWAKDASGNVSTTVVSRSVVIELGDTTPPAVTFIIPSASSSLTVAIDTFTATDNVGVTGYLLTETATKPGATASGWTTTPPESYTCSSGGSKTLYAWAKDAAGNVSAVQSATVAIATSDTRTPVVTRFEVPRMSSRPTVSISLRASDNVGVTGYLVTETATKPSPSASGWRASAPSSYNFTSGGTKTLRAWAKDAAGNVSAGVLRSVVIRWSGHVSDDDDDDDRDREREREDD